MTTYTSAMVNSWFNAIQFQNGVTATVNQYVTLLNNGSLTQQAVINNIIQDSYTLNTVNPVLRLYQASFNSIPDQGGQEFWTDQYATGAFTFQSMADFFANSAQFTAEYGTTGASQQASSAVVTAMYYNILLRAPDAAGLAFWTQPGFTVGFVLANFASSVEFTNDSSVPFSNYQNAQISALPVSDGGTGTPLPATPYSVYNYPGFPVTTVALTTNIETLNIGDNTTVTGVVTGPLGVSVSNTLNAGDAINAPVGALNTTLSVTDTATGVTAVNGVILSNVNTVRVTNLDATGAHTYNMSQATGLATVGTQSAIEGSGTTFSNLGNLVNGSIVQGAGTLTLGFNSSVVSGSSNAIGLTLNGAATTTGQTATLVADGIETINVTTTGAASGKSAGGVQTAGVVITDADLKTLNISGNQSVVLVTDMDGALATSSSTVATVNASGLTGNLDIDLEGAGGAYISVTGGSGSDTIRVNALSTNSTIAGGAGTSDVLWVNSINTPSTAFTNVSGFEGIGFNGPVTTAQNLSNAGTINQVFYNNTADGAAALQGVASGVTVNYLFDNGANTNAIEVTNASAGTADVVNINLGSTSTLGQIRAGIVTASNIETLNIASNSQTGALLTLNGAQITDASVQTINVSGNQSFEFFGPTGGSSLTTVNAGTSTASFIMGTETISLVTVSSDGATVTGGAGNDTLLGGTGNDSISGGNGNDILNAFNGNNTLIGGAGNDSIYGGTGNDSMSGGDGSDRFIFDADNTLTSRDTVSGGTGTNSIRVTGLVTLADSAFTNVSGVPTVQSNSAAGTTSINVTLGANAAAAGVNTINAFFNTGTSTYTGANDLSVTATSSYTGAATINAGTGAHNDTIAFGGSSASFTYNVQDNQLTAGDAITGGTTVNDTINITASGDGVGSTLTNVTNVETVNILANGTDSSLGAKVTIGSDTVVVLGQAMTVNASALSNNSAAFTFDGSAETTTGANAGRFSVTGGAGNDSITGGSGNDTVNAGVGNDSVTAGAGNDSIDGGAGNNTLIGGAGNDTITAGSGNDQLTGGADADSLTAGAGNDTFVYTTATDSTATNTSAQATLDTIDGFNAGDGTDSGVIDQFATGVAINSVGTVTISSASTSTLAANLQGNATLASTAAGTAQVITISGGTAAGTYVAIITGAGGYSSTRDTLVKLTNATNVANISTNNFVLGDSSNYIPGVAFTLNSATGAFDPATRYANATAARAAGVTTVTGSSGVTDTINSAAVAGATTFNFATGALSGGGVNANAAALAYLAFDQYTAGADGSTVTLSTGAESVTGGAGTDVVNVGGLTATGTYSLINTIGASNGAVLSGVNAGAATSATNLTLIGDAQITMTEAQNNGLNGVITATGTNNRITIASGNLSTVTGLANIESYVLGDDTTGDAVTFAVAQANQSVTSNSANDVLTLTIGTGINYTGTATAGITGSIVSMTGTNDISTATFNSNFTKLTLAASSNTTLTIAQHNQLTAGAITAANRSTLTMSDAGIFTTAADADLNYQLAIGTNTLTLGIAAQSITGNTGDDTIKSTVAILSGSSIAGGTGTDTLELTTADTVNVNNLTTGGVVSAMETLTLANGTNTISFTGSSGIKNVNGGTGADGITITNMATGGSLILGNGDDSISAVTETFMGVGGTTITTISGGGGTDTLTFANALDLSTAGDETILQRVSGIEAFNFGTLAAGANAVTLYGSDTRSLTAATGTGGITVTSTMAQANAVTSITNTTGTQAFNLTFSDVGNLDLTSGRITITSDVDVLTFATGANTLTINSTNLAKISADVVAADADDTLVATNTLSVTDNIFNAFETISAATGVTAINITDSGLDVARTINGNNGNNVISVGAAVAIKTVSLGLGADTYATATAAAAAATGRGLITDFTAGTTAGVADTFTFTGFTLTGTDGFATNNSIQDFTTAGNLAVNAAAEVVRVTSGTIAANLMTTTATNNLNGANLLLAIGGTVTGAIAGTNSILFTVEDQFGNTGIYSATSTDNAIIASEINLVGVLSGVDSSLLVVSNFSNS